MARCEASNTHVYVPYLYSHHVGNFLAMNRFEQAAKARAKVIAMIQHGSEQWANAEMIRKLGDAER